MYFDEIFTYKNYDENFKTTSPIIWPRSPKSSNLAPLSPHLFFAHYHRINIQIRYLSLPTSANLISEYTQTHRHMWQNHKLGGLHFNTLWNSLPSQIGIYLDMQHPYPDEFCILYVHTESYSVIPLTLSTTETLFIPRLSHPPNNNSCVL